MVDDILREKMKTSEFKDVKLEKMLIGGMLRYQEVLRKCSEVINPEMFSSNRIKWIYEQIIDFYNKNNVVMNGDSFKIYLEKKASKERPVLIKLWDNIYVIKKKVKSATCYAAIMKLTKMYEARIMEISIQRTILSLTKAIEGGESHIAEAIREYKSIVDKIDIKHVQVKMEDPISLYNDFKLDHIKKQKDPEKYFGIPTGIEEIDVRMHGLRPSEFGLITAGTGVGKSIMLLDFAYHCFMFCGDTLYITIEMPGSQLRERFYCRVSGIAFENFRGLTLNDEHWKLLDRKMNKLAERHEFKFNILDIPQSCTVMTLKNEVESFLKKHNPPKLIVIDYLNIMQGGFDWTKQLEIAVAIKQQIARYFKIPTWSANQLMGSKHDKDHVRIPDMGFAKNIADNIDVGIGIALTDETVDEGIFNIDFYKTRDFAAKGFKIQADRSRMTFTKAITKDSQKKFKSKVIGGDIEV